MLARLPEYIDPLHLADKRGELKGQIPVSSLDRLADVLFNDTGVVTVDLFFGREGRLAKVEGQIEAVLELKCQSCLQAVQWPVKNTVKLGIVTSIDQADRLPEDYEPLLVDDEKILLKNIIEDELLLVLPAFPKHQHDCLANNSYVNKAGSLTDEQQSPPENPFSILAKLKNTGDL
ncbi:MULTISPECIES: YceD family protein [Methylobacter]|uniref:YceD family protein n=1 Tax=Methylobacter sp. TaxID=2051955 RepID=UPI0025DF0EE5|nr:YceD family protein [Methylobacter sp.]MCK9619792.1 YceD family protein [Methylobacter sp.]